MGRVAEWRDDLGGVTTTGGSANAITITANSAFTAYATGLIVTFKAAADNTTGITINVNSIGAKVARKFAITGGESALGAGDIQEGGLYTAIYDAALNSSAGGWHIYNTSLGTASTRDTGTSGAALPLLNASNTWSAGTTQNFNGDVTLGNDSSDAIRIGQNTSNNPGVSNTDVGGAFLSDSFRISNASGTAIFANVNTDTTLVSFRRSGTQVGSVSVTSSATTFNTTSDGRLKANFRDFDAGALIGAINVYRFDWKAGGSGYGVKAQEARQVFPDAVSTGSEGDAPGDATFAPWGVDYSKYVPLLIRDNQDLRQQLAALSERLGLVESGRGFNIPAIEDWIHHPSERDSE
ncbi:hypothetical protein MesoLjLb_18680 [Mesorhizobium sp. L-8-3]|nr:hypothetical protein MesoLjLb_18680 [Mesorhizobium sp. L-8-3]